MRAYLVAVCVLAMSCGMGKQDELVKGTGVEGPDEVTHGTGGVVRDEGANPTGGVKQDEVAIGTGTDEEAPRSSEGQDRDDDSKTTICHVPPGNPDQAHTITVGTAAVQAHLRNHELDHEGPCETCLAEGENCKDTNAQCCPGFACQHGLGNPICVVCREAGEHCNISAPCCAGLACNDSGRCG